MPCARGGECVCVCVCYGWLSTCSLMCSVLLQFNRFCINSLPLSLPEHYFHSLCHAPILVHTVFFLLLSFTILSLPLIPVELSLDCYSALSSIVLLIYLSRFFFSFTLCTSLISLSLFHIVLQSYQTGLTYIHSCRRDPFQKRLLLPRQQIFSLQILQDVVTAHLRVK